MSKSSNLSNLFSGCYSCQTRWSQSVVFSPRLDDTAERTARRQEGRWTVVVIWMSDLLFNCNCRDMCRCWKHDFKMYQPKIWAASRKFARDRDNEDHNGFLGKTCRPTYQHEHEASETRSQRTHTEGYLDKICLTFESGLLVLSRVFRRQRDTFDGLLSSDGRGFVRIYTVAN